MTPFGPRGTSAYNPTRLYRIWKETGASSSTLVAEIITRQTVQFRDQSGTYVRYEGWYQLMHPESEFHAFILEQKNTVGAVAVDHKHYDKKKSEALPFIVLWEPHLFGY
jgi:hypothetical protein